MALSEVAALTYGYQAKMGKNMPTDQNTRKNAHQKSRVGLAGRNRLPDMEV